MEELEALLNTLKNKIAYCKNNRAAEYNYEDNDLLDCLDTMEELFKGIISNLNNNKLLN